MAEVKKTQKDFFNELLGMGEVQANAEMVEFISSRIAQLEKKRSGSKKENAEKVALQTTLVEVLIELGKPATVGEIMKKMPEYSNQKITANLKGIDGVVRVEEKGVAYYSYQA